ncbi:uncharacterized protein [Diadema setosum]|uniref:uncharacterized protein n=1 Tax=Diadema setosum TaxID=31175 RepID=UPI003B3B8752
MDVFDAGASYSPAPARVEGWLEVFEEHGLEFTKPACFDALHLIRWKIQYIVLQYKQKRLYHCDNKQSAVEIQHRAPGPTVRLDKEQWNLYQPWSGSYSLPSAASPRIRRSPSLLRKAQKDISHDGGDNRKRRKSAPSGPVQMSPDPNQPSKLSGIPLRMKKALKRTKSVGKFERSERQHFRPTREDIEEFESPGMFGSHHLKPSRSHESLNLGPQSTLEAIDLGGNDLVVRPLHSSILNQEHCFQIKTSLGSKYYSCRSASERDKWIESILSAHYPDKDSRKRTDSSLNIWVVEAKHIPQKKKYFCEICLDESLYARTTPKQRGDMVFWGEQFTFKCLPAVEAINVHVYKEIEKKKRRDKNYIGVVAIPVNKVNSKTTVESWYPISSAINFRGDTPSVRIKARYQNVTILPISQYSELAQYLKENSVTLCHRLEQDIGVKTKEEVATSLMKVLHCLGTAHDFLTEMVMKETESIKDESLVFRANTMATKSMEAYMKLIGGKYLQDTLGDFIQYLYMTNEDCEVDPERIQGGGTLAEHQASLMVMCEMASCKILNSSASFPSDLRAIFHRLRQLFAERINGEEICTKLISGCIFLRFLCPAIMSPSLFELIQEYPDEKTSRCLTLIAKTVQALANFTKFGTKESYMLNMNEFLEREWGNMKVFLQEISSGSDKSHAVKFSGYIDLGRELALTHSLLSEAMEKFDKTTKEKLDRLPTILAKITEKLNEPEKLIPYQSGEVHISNTMGSATSSNSSTTSTAASQAKKNLSKIFEEGEGSSTSDVEMLPLYAVAMDKTITKSSTINSLVDFIQQDNDPSVQVRHLDGDTMNNRNNADIMVEPSHSVVSKSEIQVNVGHFSQDPVGSSGKDTLVTLEESPCKRNRAGSERSVEGKEKKKVYTIHVDTLCSNAKPGPSISTSNTSKPKNGDSGQKVTQPLSFSNPAFQFSRSLRQRDAGTDSMSSINSTPSNGADSDASNLDGDVSHSSSSSVASPPRNRRDKGPRGQTFDCETVADRMAPPGHKGHMVHTLPKATPRSTKEMIGEIFQTTETPKPSSSSIHFTPTLQIGSTAVGTVDSVQQRMPSATLQQPPFSTLMQDANSNNQWTQTSEATFQISSGGQTGLPEFSLSMPNPKQALSESYGLESAPTLPMGSSGQNVVKDANMSHMEVMLTTPDDHKSSTNKSKMAHIRITPTHPVKKSPESLITHSSTAVVRPSVLETAFPANNNRTANNSKGQSHQHSPPMGQMQRRNIITQFSSKPKQVPESAPDHSAAGTVTTEAIIQQVPRHHHRVQSSQVVHRIQPVDQMGQLPIWTKRTADSPRDKDVQTDFGSQVEYEAEISTLKEELDRMASQLAETKRKLDEEEAEAEAALAEMRLKVEKTEVELKVQKEEKDQQIRDVIHRLMCVEEELRAEQEEMRGVIKAKEKIIDAQEIRIRSLDQANQRLMTALQVLKQRYVANQH